jgi:glycosyltransferase involved in cell wall biosynthesis
MIYVSIILSTYNHEKTVGQCLESIIAQENADLQMECIIVDDCSSDETLPIIRRVVGSYSGNISFRIYRHQSHHGLSRSRNTGLQRAQGYYVLFVNGADMLRFGCIDTYMVNLMRNWDVDVIAGNAYNLSLKRNLFSNISSPLVLHGKGESLYHEMLRSHLYLYANNKLVRRELLMANQTQFSESMSYGDIQWAFDLFSQVSSVVLLPDVTYEYGKHETSTIGHTEKWVNALLSSYTATCESLLDKAPRPEGSDGSYYLAHQLFVFGLLSHGDMLVKEFSVSNQVKRELSNVRSRLVSQTKNDGQKMLHLFFRQEGSIFSGLLKNPAFRNYRHVIAEITELLGVLVGR